MVAIASLLDEMHTDRMNQLIFLLEREFGMKGVQMTPDPHLTWLTASDTSLPYLQEALGKAADLCCRLKIRTTGLGVFPGEKPVLYIPVIRNSAINQFQAHLYESIQCITPEIGANYRPDYWMPHLTLALADTSPAVVAQALLYLNNFDFNWEIELNNLTLLTKHGDKFLQDGLFHLEDAKEPYPVKIFTKY